MQQENLTKDMKQAIALISMIGDKSQNILAGLVTTLAKILADVEAVDDEARRYRASFDLVQRELIAEKTARQNAENEVKRVTFDRNSVVKEYDLLVDEVRRMESSAQRTKLSTESILARQRRPIATLETETLFHGSLTIR